MRIGEEHLSSDALIAYPFVDTASGLTRDGLLLESACLPPGVFVDALLLVDACKPVYLASLTYPAGDVPVEFQLTTADSAAYLTLSVTKAELAGTEHYVLLSGTTAGGDAVRIVLSTRGLTRMLELYGVAYGTWSFGLTLPFCASVIQPKATYVQSIALHENEASLLEERPRITGDIKLCAGHNIDLQVDTADGDLATIELNALPGAGLGRWPCVDDPLQTEQPTFMGLTPENGNIQIEGGPDGCYEIVTVPEANQIQIYGTCSACCACDDYVAVLEAIRRMGVRFTNIMEKLTHGRTRYESGVTTYNTYATKGPGTSLLLEFNGMRGRDPVRVPGIGGSYHLVTVAGSPNYARFVLNCKNTGPRPLVIHQIALTLNDNAIIDDVAWQHSGSGVTGGKVPPGDMLGTAVLDLPTGGTLAPREHIVFTILAHVPIARYTGAWSGLALVHPLCPSDASYHPTLNATVAF